MDDRIKIRLISLKCDNTYKVVDNGFYRREKLPPEMQRYTLKYQTEDDEHHEFVGNGFQYDEFRKQYVLIGIAHVPGN